MIVMKVEFIFMIIELKSNINDILIKFLEREECSIGGNLAKSTVNEQGFKCNYFTRLM